MFLFAVILLFHLKFKNLSYGESNIIFQINFNIFLSIILERIMRHWLKAFLSDSKYDRG